MGLTIEGKYHLHQLHDERLAEPLLCMHRSVGLIACEVGDFLSKIYHPSLRSHSSLPIARLFFVGDHSRTLQAT